MFFPAAVLIYFRFILYTPASLEDISEMKYAPPDAKGADVIKLSGEWEMRLPGGEWTAIKAPSDPATVYGLDTSRGVLRFRKKANVSQLRYGEKPYLCCNGLGGTADIFINNKKLAENIFGFIPFELPIPDDLAISGDIELIVDVKPTKNRAAILGTNGLGPDFGKGVFRDIFIEKRGAVAIKNARLKRSAEAVSVEVALSGNTSFPTAVSM